MKSVTFAAVAAAMALVCSPVAQAQQSVGCRDIQQILAQAPTGFVAVRGRQINRADSVYVSQLALPGATACELMLKWESIYYCVWEYADEAAARAGYNALQSIVSQCLTGWKPRAIFDGKRETEATIALRVFSRNVGSDGAQEALVHLKQVKGSSTSLYQVWYELTDVYFDDE